MELQTCLWVCRCGGSCRRARLVSRLHLHHSLLFGSETVVARFVSSPGAGARGGVWGSSCEFHRAIAGVAVRAEADDVGVVIWSCDRLFKRPTDQPLHAIPWVSDEVETIADPKSVPGLPGVAEIQSPSSSTTGKASTDALIAGRLSLANARVGFAAERTTWLLKRLAVRVEEASFSASSSSICVGDFSL